MLENACKNTGILLFILFTFCKFALQNLNII